MRSQILEPLERRRAGGSTTGAPHGNRHSARRTAGLFGSPQRTSPLLRPIIFNISLLIFISSFNLAAAQSSNSTANTTYALDTCSVVTASAACDSYGNAYGCKWCGDSFGCLLAEPFSGDGVQQTGLFECPRACRVGDSPCFTIGGTMGQPYLFNYTVQPGLTCYLQQVKCTVAPCTRAYYCGQKCQDALVRQYGVCQIGWADGSNPSDPPEASEIGIYVDPTVPKTGGVNMTVALAVSIPIAVVLISACVGCIVLHVKKHNEREKALDEAAGIERSASGSSKKSNNGASGGAMSKVSMFTVANNTKAGSGLDSAALAAAMNSADSPLAYEKTNTMSSDAPSLSSTNSAGTLVLTATEEAERRAETGEWEVQRMLDGRPISVVPKSRNGSVNRVSSTSKAPETPRTGSDAASNRSRGSASSAASNSSLSNSSPTSPFSESISKKAQRALIQQQAEQQLAVYMPVAIGLSESPSTASPTTNGLTINTVDAITPPATRPSTPRIGTTSSIGSYTSPTSPIRAPQVLPLPVPSSPTTATIKMPTTPHPSPKPPVISEAGDPNTFAAQRSTGGTPAQHIILNSTVPTRPLASTTSGGSSLPKYGGFPMAATISATGGLDPIAQLRLDAANAVAAVESGTGGAGRAVKSPDRVRMWKDVFDEI